MTRLRRGTALLLAALLLTAVAAQHSALRVLQAAAMPTAQSVQLPILMYHHLLQDTSRLNKYTISPEELRADLEFLQRAGYTPILVRDLIDHTQNGTPLPEKPVMLTFDDGYESFYAYAFPLLQEYSMPAVYSVIGRYADQYTDHEDHHINYSHCSWPQLKELADSGLVEIQNHSYDLHSYDRGRQGAMMVAGESADSYDLALRADLGRLQAQCEDWLGAAPTAFAYPFGYVSAESLQTLRDMGFLAALTCSERVNVLDGGADQLYALGRFNRPHGRSAQQIFAAAGLDPAH